MISTNNSRSVPIVEAESQIMPIELKVFETSEV